MSAQSNLVPVQVARTQGQLINTPYTPGLVRQTVFSQASVKPLTGRAFTLNNEIKIASEYKECMIVLFYTENTESQQLITVFADAAQQATGPVFAAVNLLVHSDVAQALMEIKANSGHPYHWMGIKGYPFIVAYRNGWPTGGYNGARESGAIIDYALTLACDPDYYEPVLIASGYQAESRYAMGPYNRNFDANGQPIRKLTSSQDFRVDAPVRGFNPNLPVAPTGSQLAGQAENVILQEQANLARGAQSLTSTPVGVPQPQVVGLPRAPVGSVTGSQPVIVNTAQPQVVVNPNTIPVPVRQ